MDLDVEDNFSHSSDDDDERVTVRDELKSLSFEELLKLKEEYGMKDGNSAIFKNGESTKKSRLRDLKYLKKEEFKRTNRNRPSEESSKIPVKFKPGVSSKNESRPRDPRFDPLCGEFNKTAFLKSYEFVNKIKTAELNKLQNLYRKEEDPEEKSKIKLVVNRLKNQKRSQQVQEAKSLVKQSERDENLRKIKEDGKPRFKRKSERKALDLIKKYEQLKADGKFEKYVKKKNKGNKSKNINFNQPF